MSTTSKRYVWLPPVLTATCAASYLAPIPASLFPLHLERLSSIGAPAFVVFLQLDSLTDSLHLSYAKQRFIASLFLIMLLLSWFTFVFLPFWRSYSLFGLSLRTTRWVFAFGGVVLTVWCWLALGSWRVHDA